MNIFARSGIKAGDTVAIIGIGFLGAILTDSLDGHLAEEATSPVSRIAP